jgi:aldehyde dehydrogenase (NAD+)
VVIGPLIDENGVKKAEAHVADAVSKGAKVILGGKRHQRGGLFFEPTVIADVTPAMLVSREETFGPVAPLIRFKTEDEVVALANDSEFGLASAIWTNDLGRAHTVARRLVAGTVWVNTYRASAAQAPFGGVRRSGYGRERGREALDEYLRTKNVMIDLSGSTPDPFAPLE